MAALHQGEVFFATGKAALSQGRWPRTSGFAIATPLCSAAMFEPIREQIETAAVKTTQLRRFL